MDVCKYCKKYHPEWHVCDEYIKWLAESKGIPWTNKHGDLLVKKGE